jgi:hypothetical protein
LNDHKVSIVGISDASAPFVSFPVIHTRYSEAIDFQGRERKQLSFVLARPDPGVGAAELARESRQPRVCVRGQPTSSDGTASATTLQIRAYR